MNPGSSSPTLHPIRWVPAGTPCASGSSWASRPVKSLGWKWDKTRRTDPTRVSRHWLVLSVATLLALAYGTRVEDAQERRIAPGNLRAPPKALAPNHRDPWSRPARTVPSSVIRHGIDWLPALAAQGPPLEPRLAAARTLRRRNPSSTWRLLAMSHGKNPIPTPVSGSSPQKGGQAAQALGRSRGGFSTKIHVSVDGLGNPLRFILTGGQQHDITQAEELIAGYAGEHVLADQGYDAQEFRQHILELGMMPVIPPRSNRKAPADYDRHLYRERHLVECFINKIKHYRRIFSRFEKLDTRYLGFLHFTAALIWLR